MLASLIFFCPPLKAQWRAICTKTELRDTAFNVRRVQPGAFRNAFYFPEYSYPTNMHAATGGMDCPSTQGSGTFRASFAWPLTTPDDSLVVQARLYAENVAHFTYWYYSGRKATWRTKTVALPFGGFQIPTTDLVSAWDVTGQGPAGWTKTPDGQKDLLLITFLPADTTLPGRLVIGELVVARQTQLTIPVDHPFFDRAFGSPGCMTPALSHPPLSSTYFGSSPAEMVQYAISPQITLVRDRHCPGTEDELTVFKRIVRSSVKAYPYFTEHGLNKTAIIDSLDAMLSDPALQDYCLLAERSAHFIQSVFSDLHYYLELPATGPCALEKPPAVKPAIRLLELGGGIRIAAIFDTTYRDLRLDDKVLCVDGIPVERIRDSLTRTLFGNGVISPFMRYAAINAILDRNSNDSCVIATSRPGRTDTSFTVLHYNSPYRVPANFRQQHASFAMLGQTACFQIQYWEEAVFLRLINHWNELSKASSLIIDLRGNGGGELMSAMQVFSLFIDSPRLFLHYVDSNKTMVPLLINPDPHFRFPAGFKVIILGDQSTACASEAFIRAMKSRRQVWYMAAGRTAGSISAKYDIRLPHDLVLHVNCLQRKICFDSSYDEIEGRGIDPDMPITLESVTDLKPYNNKLLSQAVKFLSADSRVTPKTDQ